MPCDTFERILQNLHLCDNEQLSILRHIINELNKGFLKFSLNEENKFIERMYDSLLPNSWQKQLKNNKPVRVGYNIWVPAEA